MGKKQKAPASSLPRAPRRRIDPRLQEALRRLEEGGTIDAVIMFRDTGKKGVSAAKSLPEQAVEKLARSEPIEYNFFPNLGGVAVRTTKRGLQKLLALPDVTTATAAS